MSGTGETALYVHVPFCRSKCAYCDFTSATDAQAPVPDGVREELAARLDPGAVLADAYREAAIASVEEWARAGVLEAVPSVYFGGGTPTVLGDSLPGFVREVLRRVALGDRAEVTLEANPESTSAELVAELVGCRVTRFSLGVQSFDDEVLATLGRCHTAAEAEGAAAVLRSSDVPFSVDLICGVPGLSDASWADSVRRAIASGAAHVSVYPLSIEDNTPLAGLVGCGDLPEPDPDEAAMQMEAAARQLAAAGFERYEIASYAKPGHRARHNYGYWTGMPYVGVGPSAASMLPAEGARAALPEAWLPAVPEDARVRFVSRESLLDFLALPPQDSPAVLEVLTSEEAAREDLMLGLRTTDGVRADDVERVGLTRTFMGLAAKGLLEPFGGPDAPRWRTTERGWLLGNEVFSAVWNGE